ncbi:nickel-dependent hydrogenase large subunit [Thalassobacillus devorans]|uniref:nickel-dependent hydrogenase large subunit n=1 Tax=Thalassobacillus devorans TaxID=279813 RepID=UPI00048C4CC9|nr:nickel-dependent hydrogenase large subunit [Thalassobacillus devorans]
MARKIIINPVTRISGFLELDVTVENGVVSEARTRGMMFRGFEQMMKGRKPFDVIYLTQRICGICSTAHSVGSSLALEDALNVTVEEQGRYLRDIIHGCEFLQNHIRHFYQYSVPDYVKMPPDHPLFTSYDGDARLPKKDNDTIVNHYFESLAISRLAHQMLALFGGKAPHNHGVYVGGYTTPATAVKIIEAKSMLQKIRNFIVDRMIPDTYTISRYYPELFQMGKGPGNLMSCGAFHGYEALGTLYTEPLVFNSKTNKTSPFDADLITENINYSWYQGKKTYKPFETMPEPDMEKEDAYTWVKAPRYDGMAVEVGPLARLWLSGDYRNGISAMDRTIARSLEAAKVAGIIATLLDQVVPDYMVQKEWELPSSAQGAGLVETTRGTLGHWLKIEDGMISFYQIITPSAWDYSASDENSLGTAEQAVMGTTIADPEQPVELGRILRSFDPCMSCATHVSSPGQETKTIQVF